VPAFLFVGVLWGAVYGLVAETLLPASWPDWLKGLAFSVLPLMVSLGVAMPLIGLGFFGVGATGAVAVTGELMRHAAYGVVLGLLYPVFRLRRPVKVMAHTPEEVSPASLAEGVSDRGRVTPGP
jgi:hypothetical protein